MNGNDEDVFSRKERSIRGDREEEIDYILSKHNLKEIRDWKDEAGRV